MERGIFLLVGNGAIKTALGNWQRALARVGTVAGITFHAHQLVIPSQRRCLQKDFP
jgi:hypothetical protein